MARERIWFSPACIQPRRPERTLFDLIEKRVAPEPEAAP
jgi:hypothetical protein